jgi:hypothetical protein
MVKAHAEKYQAVPILGLLMIQWQPKISCFVGFWLQSDHLQQKKVAINI